MPFSGTPAKGRAETLRRIASGCVSRNSAACARAPALRHQQQRRAARKTRPSTMAGVAKRSALATLVLTAELDVVALGNASRRGAVARRERPSGIALLVVGGDDDHAAQVLSDSAAWRSRCGPRGAAGGDRLGDGRAQRQRQRRDARRIRRALVGVEHAHVTADRDGERPPPRCRATWSRDRRRVGPRSGPGARPARGRCEIAAPASGIRRPVESTRAGVRGGCARDIGAQAAKGRVVVAEDRESIGRGRPREIVTTRPAAPGCTRSAPRAVARDRGCATDAITS